MSQLQAVVRDRDDELRLLRKTAARFVCNLSMVEWAFGEICPCQQDSDGWDRCSGVRTCMGGMRCGQPVGLALVGSLQWQQDSTGWWCEVWAAGRPSIGRITARASLVNVVDDICNRCPCLSMPGQVIACSLFTICSSLA